jgi:hypothetical protein
LTVPDGGAVLSRPRPTLGCSTHDDDDDIPSFEVAFNLRPERPSSQSRPGAGKYIGFRML